MGQRLGMIWPQAKKWPAVTRSLIRQEMDSSLELDPDNTFIL